MESVKALTTNRETEAAGLSKYDTDVKSTSNSDDDDDESETDDGGSSESASESYESEVDSQSDISESMAEDEDEDSEIFSSDEEDDDDEEEGGGGTNSPSFLTRLVRSASLNTCSLMGDNACMFGDGYGSTLLKESHGTPYSTALYRNRRREMKKSERYLKRFSRRMRSKEVVKVQKETAAAKPSQQQQLKEITRKKEKKRSAALKQKQKNHQQKVQALSQVSSTASPVSLKQRLQNMVTDRRNKRHEQQSQKSPSKGSWKKIPRKQVDRKKEKTPIKSTIMNLVERAPSPLSTLRSKKQTSTTTTAATERPTSPKRPTKGDPQPTSAGTKEVQFVEAPKSSTNASQPTKSTVLSKIKHAPKMALSSFPMMRSSTSPLKTSDGTTQSIHQNVPTPSIQSPEEAKETSETNQNNETSPGPNESKETTTMPPTADESNTTQTSPTETSKPTTPASQVTQSLSNTLETEAKRV